MTIDKEQNKIIGKRGLRANEWNSITAVYYKSDRNRLQLYVNTKITQDITGGWHENRAKKVGELIHIKLIKLKKNDYQF